MRAWRGTKAGPGVKPHQNGCCGSRCCPPVSRCSTASEYLQHVQRGTTRQQVSTRRRQIPRSCSLLLLGLLALALPLLVPPPPLLRVQGLALAARPESGDIRSVGNAARKGPRRAHTQRSRIGWSCVATGMPCAISPEALWATHLAWRCCGCTSPRAIWNARLGATWPCTSPPPPLLPPSASLAWGWALLVGPSHALPRCCCCCWACLGHAPLLPPSMGCCGPADGAWGSQEAEAAAAESGASSRREKTLPPPASAKARRGADAGLGAVTIGSTEQRSPLAGPGPLLLPPRGGRPPPSSRFRWP